MVADTGNSRIEESNTESKYLSTFGSVGSEPGKLNEPRGVAIDSEGHVLVSDTGNNRVQEFSPTGSFLSRFGSEGSGDGQLNSPQSVTVGSTGNILIVDRYNNRVEEFSPAGAYITQFGGKEAKPGELHEPKAMALDSHGDVWVTDNSNIVSRSDLRAPMHTTRRSSTTARKPIPKAILRAANTPNGLDWYARHCQRSSPNSAVYRSSLLRP